MFGKAAFCHPPADRIGLSPHRSGREHISVDNVTVLMALFD